MAAFQHEMGASVEAVDDKSDWYVWLHDPKNVQSGVVSGDVPELGPGYWDLYEEDHRWADWLGLNAWRTNPDWSRIFPRSTKEVEVSITSDDRGVKDIEVSESALTKLDLLANRRAVRHYRAVFGDVKRRGMKLVLNLYHWALPLWIHEPIAARDGGSKSGTRGWIDGTSVVEFAKYAAYVAWKFGDLVDIWSTMTEPNMVWNGGFLEGSFPPGLRDARLAERVSVNLAQAHARAYDQIKRHAGKRAKVGVMYATSPSFPLTDSSSDAEAAKASDEASTKWFFEAIGNGRIQRAMANDEITRADLKNRLDWIGVNYFSRSVVKHTDVPPFFEIQPNYGFLCQPNSKSSAGLPTSDSGWEICPEGIRKALDLYKEYGKPLMISSNGIADAEDKRRTWYLLSHLYNLRVAIRDVGLDVMGYLHWSLTDNLEWSAGLKEKFGLLQVDTRTKKRSPRPSACVYHDVIKSNGIPEYLAECSEYPNTSPG
jgi:beta-galactosidase